MNWTVFIIVITILSVTYQTIAFIGVFRLHQREGLGINIGALFPFVRTFTFYRIAESKIESRESIIGTLFEAKDPYNPAVKNPDKGILMRYKMFYLILFLVPITLVLPSLLFPPFYFIILFCWFMLVFLKVRAFSIIAEMYSENPKIHVLIATLTLGLSVFIQCFIFAFREKIKDVRKVNWRL